MANARDVLLIGSVPLGDSENVMKTAAQLVGPALKRVPDGETGPRSKFITWQEKVLAQVEQLEVKPLGPQAEWGPNGELPPQTVFLKPGASGEPRMPRTGYGQAAIESYKVFRRLKQEGTIAPGTRFQAGLPTPLGVLSAFGDDKMQAFCEKAYRNRMMEDIDEMAANIPHTELTIQWDLPLEVAIWEGQRSTFLKNPREDSVDKLVEMMNRVPAGIEQGLHLCYGDISHRHWKEPDVAIMVGLTNKVAEKYGKPFAYVHFPVPKQWTEDRHYAEFGKLRLPARTKVYLGLVHQTDGVEGAKKRIASAKRYLPDFGVATSCGLGRRKPADIPAIFSLHKDVAERL
jgi:hypothetical protein